MGHPDVSEYDLHALVDGQLAGERRHDVMVHLAAHPDAAARVATLAGQRAQLAALRESLPDAGMASPLAELGETLGRVVRRQRRVRRAITVAGAIALAVAAGRAIGRPICQSSHSVRCTGQAGGRMFSTRKSPPGLA
jgi:anti-sigma factor RsiW